MLNSDQRNALKSKLLELQEELTQQVALGQTSAQTVDLDQSLQGRVSRGDALQQQEMAKAGLVRNRKHLVLISHALERMEQDDYGYCAECDEAIPYGRLQIMPDAELCVKCSETHE